VRVTSADGRTPVVTLRGPGGETITTSAEKRLVTGDGIMAAVGPDPSQTLIAIARPKPGTWQVQPVAGAPAIGKVELAGVLPRARIHVRVTRGAGRTRLLHWSASGLGPDHLTFAERGRDSGHTIGTVSGTAGVLRFVPADALGRARRISAQISDPGGMPATPIRVGAYTAPGPQHGAAIARATLVRHGLHALLRWSAAPGARDYVIAVRGSDGRRQTFFARPGRRSLTIHEVLAFQRFTATIRAEAGPNRLPGPARTVVLAATQR